MKAFKCNRCHKYFDNYNPAAIPVRGFVRIGYEKIVRDANRFGGRGSDLLVPDELHLCKDCEKLASEVFIELFEKDYHENHPKIHYNTVDEDDIDDHNSNWGGAGPDCSTVRG